MSTFYIILKTTIWNELFQNFQLEKVGDCQIKLPSQQMSVNEKSWYM
jgi:hypothetical protein